MSRRCIETPLLLWLLALPVQANEEQVDKLLEISELSTQHFLCMELAATENIGAEDERLLSDSMTHWAEAIRLYREQFDLMMEVAPPAFLEQMQPAFEWGLGADYFAGAQHANSKQRAIDLVTQKCREVDKYCTVEDRSMYAARIYRDEKCYALIKNS